MPDLDPAWEYWLPDPEVAEILAGNAARGFDALGIESFRLARRGALEGFRFGRGNPDHCRFRLAPLKLRLPDRPPVAPRPCKTCGFVFQPDREARWYCSRPCVPRPGRERALDDIACGQCGTPFRPAASATRFCSVACASRHLHAGKAAVNRHIDPDLFRELYEAGASRREMCERFGVRPDALKKARKRLGLASRPTGRPRAPL